ncbi:uncharacterized protein N7515_008821 [Penicillium bovifimosum]|uniref:Uncharacterized protein n=1 Tax=Penicillium bovifimosum TaxID=126998 RepID=A0A9W9GNS8_9EURO|nr:uncharacterized protein N7515_008821 [Penicillium bovifimosum]KAJ5124996.1 hypothetical protein N7515_008821 [Penicillium bovifimosum]
MTGGEQVASLLKALSNIPNLLAGLSEQSQQRPVSKPRTRKGPRRRDEPGQWRRAIRRHFDAYQGDSVGAMEISHGIFQVPGRDIWQSGIDEVDVDLNNVDEMKR